MIRPQKQKCRSVKKTHRPASGADDRARTGTGVEFPSDFKSEASANSATSAWEVMFLRFFLWGFAILSAVCMREASEKIGKSDGVTGGGDLLSPYIVTLNRQNVNKAAEKPCGGRTDPSSAFPAAVAAFSLIFVTAENIINGGGDLSPPKTRTFAPGDFPATGRRRLPWVCCGKLSRT